MTDNPGNIKDLKWAKILGGERRRVSSSRRDFLIFVYLRWGARFEFPRPDERPQKGTGGDPPQTDGSSDSGRLGRSETTWTDHY